MSTHRTSTTIGVKVNGVDRSLEPGATVTDVVAAVLPAAVDDAGRPRGVAVAVDEHVVPRPQWDSTILDDGAVVEIVSATPGG
ncbi:hypothetical protein GCM10009821_09860 [Aeromicrobium halocynthiae]|uniref:Sulfur carrier protein ThiS n=1 Tax=Aeromicrobium halocynthiae TaxID=560557 RepID=A0ABN2VV72_9ACTN